MQILDNITATVKNDLKVCLRRDSKLSIATPCFYANYGETEEQSPQR